MRRTGILEYGRYRALLDAWVRWIAAAIRQVDPYAQKLFVHKTGGWFIITEIDCPPQTGHNYFERRRGKNSG